MSWLERTHQTWKNNLAMLSPVIGFAAFLLISSNLHRARSGLRSVVAQVLLVFSISLTFGGWIFGALIRCQRCGFRPYLHEPITKGASLARLNDCPNCRGGVDFEAPVLYWTAPKVLLVASTLLVVWGVAEFVLHRGVR